MKYTATADTDVGTVKTTNQDSLLIRHADSELGEVLMAVVCDGMGGLAKGELASAHVIRQFDRWFETDLPAELGAGDLSRTGEVWVNMLRRLNEEISDFGSRSDSSMGTTFTGMLFVGDRYLIVHVGDSRAYCISTSLVQLTTDQTFIAREIREGRMTPEQARTDRRRNVLLQCVGASRSVTPEVTFGTVRQGSYLLCSDGFRHEISPEEIYESLNPANLFNEDAMHGNVRYLINLILRRRERDNISAILIKAE